MSDAAAVAPVAPAEAAPTEAPAEAQGKPAPKSVAEAKPEARKLPQPFKVKHKGKEVVIDTEEKAQHYISKGFGAHEFFEQGRKAKEEAEAKLSKYARLKSEKPEDILAVLVEETGDEEKALERLEAILYEKRVKAAQMTPEQRAIAERDAKLAEYARKEQEAKQKAEQEVLDKQTQAELDRWSKTAMDTLQAGKIDPKIAPVVLSRMKPYIDAAIEMNADPAAPEVFADYIADEKAVFKSIAESMEGDALVEWLGEAAANKIRKWDLARLRNGNAPKPAQPQPTPGSVQNVPITTSGPKKRSSFWDVDPHRE